MRQVSKTLLLSILFVSILTSTFAGVILDAQRAEALSSQSKNSVLVSTKVFASSKAAVNQAVRPEIDIFGGICAVTTITMPSAALLCPVAEAVVDKGVEVAKEAGGALLDAVATIGYEAVGGLVSWAGNGVVSLVIGMHEECMAGSGKGLPIFGGKDATSANITSLQTAQCDTRIAMDYFPAGGGEAELENLDRAALAEDFYVPRSAVASPVFNRDYRKYGLFAVMLMVPMIIAAALQSVITGKPFLLFKSVFLHMPAAIFGIALTPYFTKQFMMITDSWSYFVASDIRHDMAEFFGNSGVVIGGVVTAWATLIPFLLVALFFAFACLLIWFILSMREASIALVAVFMPIALAGSIWPALAKWALRAIKLLVAAIISKVFIVGAISLGIGVFSGSTAGGQISFSHLIYGSTIFFISAFSPHLVMRFFDELGEALHAAGGTGAANRMLSVGGNANSITGGGIGRMLGFGRSGGGTSGGDGGGGGGNLGQIAQLAAATKASAGGTASETGAAAARSAKAGGGTPNQQIHAASMGAEEGKSPGGGSGNGVDKVAAAYDAAMGGAAPGSMDAQGGAAVGKSVAETAMAHGVSEPEAVALGQGAASHAMGSGHPGLGSANASIAAHGAGISKQARKDSKAQSLRDLRHTARNFAFSPAKTIADAARKAGS